MNESTSENERNGMGFDLFLSDKSLPEGSYPLLYIGWFMNQQSQNSILWNLVSKKDSSDLVIYIVY